MDDPESKADHSLISASDKIISRIKAEPQNSLLVECTSPNEATSLHRNLLNSTKGKFDIVLDLSSIKLRQIASEEKYKPILERGLKHCYTALLAANLIDNAEALGLDSTKFDDFFKEITDDFPKGMYSVYNSRILDLLSKAKKDQKKMVAIAGDFTQTMAISKELGLRIDLYPNHVARGLAPKLQVLAANGPLTDLKRFASQETGVATSLGIDNDIKTLGHSRLIAFTN